MKEFKTEVEVTNWLDDNYREFIHYVQNNCSNGDSQNPAYILYYYGGSRNLEYNPVLREAKGDFIKVKEYFRLYDQLDLFEEIIILDQFIRSQPLNHNIILYRFEKVNFKEMAQLLKTPRKSTVRDYGFLSTTLLPDSNGMIELRKNQKFNILFKFHVPKGIPCIPLQFSINQSILKEYEMLLPIGVVKKLIRKKLDLKRKILTLEFDLLYNGDVNLENI